VHDRIDAVHQPVNVGIAQLVAGGAGLFDGLGQMHAVQRLIHDAIVQGQDRADQWPPRIGGDFGFDLGAESG
jgi:hypothetical protein